MIVICTPTGRIGRQVLDNVLDADSGEAVRVITRDPSRLSARARERVEVVQGSLTDADAVSGAFAGGDTVFWLLPPDPRAPSAEGHMLAFTRPLCEALAEQHVRRLVYVTGLGNEALEAARPEPKGPTSAQLIDATDADYRALPCPAFMDNLLQQRALIRDQGMFCYPISGDRKLPTCATRDIATVAATLLLDSSWNGRDSIPILGPEDISYDDMARIMSEVLGRPIRYQKVPADAFTASMTQNGISEDIARRLVERLTAVDRGLYSGESRTPQSTTPTGFRQWCDDVLKPALAG